MSVIDLESVVVSGVPSMSELMANFKLSPIQNVEPKSIAALQPSPILTSCQGTTFFSNLVWEGNMAVYNDITFIRNGSGQFDVAHFLSQCIIDGDNDRKSTRTIADFVNTDPGRALRKRGCFINTTFIDYKWLDAILTYGMKDAVAKTDYLEGLEWRRVEGYLYLVKFIEHDGRITYKVGRTGDLDNRAKGYRNEAKKRGASYKELITLKVVNMYVSERVLINHFETHGTIRLQSIGREYYAMYSDLGVSETAHDIRARELFEQATQ